VLGDGWVEWVEWNGREPPSYWTCDNGNGHLALAWRLLAVLVSSSLTLDVALCSLWCAGVFYWLVGGGVLLLGGEEDEGRGYVMRQVMVC